MAGAVAEHIESAPSGRALLWTAAAAFAAIAVPVVWRGAPLADDFNNCVAPTELGLGGFMMTSWRQLGAVRPARFLEILVTGSICRYGFFWAAILVSLLVTLAVAFLTRSVLRDLNTPRLWASAAGAVWLLQPLGTEAGLWPAALHVPLGLGLALAAIRSYRRGQLGRATLANLGAALSVEQTILPLPLIAWLVAPVPKRGRAAATSAAIAAGVIAAFVVWPGANPRLRAGISERVVALAADPAFYLGFPAVGLGLHSIPLAVRWALPWSVAVLAIGLAVGSQFGARLVGASRPIGRREWMRGVAAITAVIVLANVPVIFSIPQQGSPRIFAPTWLVLAVATGLTGAAVQWRHPRFVGMAAGVVAAGALLSLILSVSVRLRSADFTVRAANVVASRIDDGATVAVCGVPRTVVDPAPRGAFAVHDFIYEWAAERAISYYTGRRTTILLAGDLWDRPCPPITDVDAVINFEELRSGVRQ